MSKKNKNKYKKEDNKNISKVEETKTETKAEEKAANVDKKDKQKEKDSKNCCSGFLTKYSDYIVPSIVVVLLVVIFVVVLARNSDFFNRTGEVTMDSKTPLENEKKVSDKVAKEIADKLRPAFEKKLVEGSKVDFGDVYESENLYKVGLTIDDEKIDVYLTKDYAVLFPANYVGSYIIDLGKTFEEVENMKNIDVKKTLGISDNSKPQLDYFVMSFCPYGNPADVNANEIFRTFGDSVNVVPHYILSESKSAPEGYTSLHGVQEAHQDIRELCVLKNFGQDKFFQFTLQANDDLTADNADEKWQEVAQKVGLDTTVIENCWKNEGLDIAKKEMEVSNAIKVAASPTIYVNGEKLAGNKASLIQESLCNSFPNGDKPTACGQEVNNAETTASGSCN